MSQSPPTTPTGSTESLPGLPSGPLSAQQQIEAVNRVQSEADKRVQLGMKIYRAAEAHTTRQQSLVDGLKSEQQQLKNDLEHDMARSLHAYDQWVGKIDEDFTKALKHLEGRIDALQHQWTRSQKDIDAMMHRSEALLDQSRTMVESTAESLAAASRKVRRPKPRNTGQQPGEHDAKATQTIEASTQQAQAALDDAATHKLVQVTPAQPTEQILNIESDITPPAPSAAPPNEPTDDEHTTSHHPQHDQPIAGQIKPDPQSPPGLYQNIIEKLNDHNDDGQDD